MIQRARTIRLREVCRDLRLRLPELRNLIERYPTFPPVTWTGERSGFLFREDLDQWIDDRHARDARRRQQEDRKREFVAGRSPQNSESLPKPLPDFLRP